MIQLVSEWLSKWVSEWLLFNANSAISWQEQVKFQWDDDDVRFVLDKHSSIFIVLVHWNNSLRIYMSPHLDTLSWFRANKSLLFFLTVVCLAKKQQMPIYSLWFDPDRDSNPRITWHTPGEHAKPMQLRNKMRKIHIVGTVPIPVGMYMHYKLMWQIIQEMMYFHIDGTNVGFIEW
jgi:hypothetical protein